MFNKLKQIKDLRSQAKKIQSTLSDEMIEHSTKGITITMDGNQNMKTIHISDDLMSDKTRLEAALIDASNETIKKVQKAMAMKLQSMGDLNLPGLGG
jgi:DNA-binding protein YbaB